MSIAEFPPELRLVLACARTRLSAVHCERIVALCRRPLDWERFLQLADQHGVDPLVWHSLRRVQQASLPVQVLSTLRHRVEHNSRYALLLTAELVRLVRLFERAGIRTFPLKGTVLALQVYGDLGRRGTGDLDLLVDSRCFTDAEQLLGGAGYVRLEPRFELSPAQAAAHHKTQHHSVYRHVNHAITVELHWQWIRNPTLFPLSFEESWQRRESITIGGSCLATLPWAEQLLYLCVHGASSAWCRLKWLCDIAELLADDQGIDIDQLLTTAQHLGVSRILAQGWRLAHELLDTPLPPPIATLIQRDSTVPILVKQAHKALLTGRSYLDLPSLKQLAHVLYMLKLRPEPRYKWLSLYCFSLHTEDYGVLPLPDRLFPLYFVLRPLLWGLRQLRRRQQQVGC